ncbi:MAG TPA: hypothetical protein VF523_07450 [Burkholderiales bacterium]
MTPRAIELDFLQPERGPSGAGVVLLVAGVAAVFMVLSLHGQLQDEAGRLETQVEKLEHRSRHLEAAGAPLDEVAQREIRRANDVIDELALPWENLFRSIEDVASDRVVVRGLAPDAKAGTVRISAETADAGSMVDYVNRLGKQSGLSGVYLLQHRREQQGGPRPIRFLVTASWIKRPG